MTSTRQYDVAIIGGGPGGYTAAIRAGQLGLSVVLVERDAVGGLCLNWGCIPSKALLHAADLANDVRKAHEFGVMVESLTLDLGAAVDRSRHVVGQFTSGIETLLRQNKVDFVEGQATLTSDHTIRVDPLGQEIDARNIIIATGGHARSLPGVQIDGERVITSKEALNRRTAPVSIIIIGGGAIGVEFGYLYRSFGSQVTIVEALSNILPSEDPDISRQLERTLVSTGIHVLKAARVGAVSIDGDGVRVSVNSGGQPLPDLLAECVLIGIGFAANTDGLGIEAVGVQTEHGWLKVDDSCRTNIPGIWAVGDVTGRMLLAHVASHQGANVVERIAGLEPPPVNYDRIPRAVHCRPQVASIGLTEIEARDRGLNVRTARFPFRANGMAMAIGETEGFTKFVVDDDSGIVVGIHALGHGASELLGEATIATALGATAKDVAHAVHAHPSLGEAMQEAALAATSGAIHFYSRARG